MQVLKNLNLALCALGAACFLFSCGGNSNQNGGESDQSGYYASESNSNSNVLRFKSSRDVYLYLNHKTFRGDGLAIKFSNEGHSVSINGSVISSNVKISDIGLNGNNVAYATVQIYNATGGGVTTLQLQAVEGRAQLIDPNDGTVYEY